jgi:hypothetical protein
MDWFEIVAPEASGEAVFSEFKLKWLSAFKMEKMVTRGRLSIHLQEAPKLYKEWGEGQFFCHRCSELLAQLGSSCRGMKSQR